MELKMNQEQYIEHEVKLRLHDARFKHLEKTIDKMEKLIYWVIGTFVAAIIIPIILHKLSLT